MLLGADIEFSNTITLGAALLGAIAVIFALYRVFRGEQLRSTNDIQARTIAALRVENGRLEDVVEKQEARLSELGAEKDNEAKASAAKDATIRALEKQIADLPKYQDFMDYTTKTMTHVDTAAQQRQQEFLSVVIDKLSSHDAHVQRIHDEAQERAIERHAETVNALQEITSALERIGGNGHATTPDDEV
jgi:hypothetical protein